MKRMIVVIPMIMLATACGSKAGSTTILGTTPPKTVTVSKTDSIQLSACKRAMEMLIDTTGLGLDAAQAAGAGNYTKAGAKADKITVKLTTVKPLVDLCRGG